MPTSLSLQARNCKLAHIWHNFAIIHILFRKSEISNLNPYLCLHYTYVTKATTDTFVLHSMDNYTVSMLTGPDWHGMEWLKEKKKKKKNIHYISVIIPHYLFVFICYLRR